MVNEMGWVKNFVCPYHGWEYRNDGDADSGPRRETGSPTGVPCDERSLKPDPV